MNPLKSLEQMPAEASDLTAAVQTLLSLIATERHLWCQSAIKLPMLESDLDDLTALALLVYFADDAVIRNALCFSLQNTAHNVLGNSEAVALLCSLLRYEATE